MSLRKKGKIEPHRIKSVHSSLARPSVSIGTPQREADDPAAEVAETNDFEPQGFLVMYCCCGRGEGEAPGPHLPPRYPTTHLNPAIVGSSQRRH
jgi:hypothetical protein